MNLQMAVSFKLNKILYSHIEIQDYGRPLPQRFMQWRKLWRDWGSAAPQFNMIRNFSLVILLGKFNFPRKFYHELGKVTAPIKKLNFRHWIHFLLGNHKGKFFFSSHDIS